MMKRKPQSVLDVGMGDGFYGFLFRRYLDADEKDQRFLYTRNKWRCHIEGIDIFPKYRTVIHDYIYDRLVFGCDCLNYFKAVPDGNGHKFDCIFIGDTIEHIEKVSAIEMLFNAVNHLNDKGFILISTPIDKIQWNKSPNENPKEAHVSMWIPDDFRGLQKSYNISSQKVGRNYMFLLDKK
jgi:hypothetical protein